jgi:hypothetical protein
MMAHVGKVIDKHEMEMRQRKGAPGQLPLQHRPPQQQVAPAKATKSDKKKNPWGRPK